MPRMDATEMSFAKRYPLLMAKAEKKGRSREEANQVTAWLTGYPPEELARLEQSDVSYGDFNLWRAIKQAYRRQCCLRFACF